MEEQTLPSIFDEVSDPFAVRRKYMIPKWIRVFAWIFAVLCPAVVVATLIGVVLNGGIYNGAIYGFTSTTLISLAGMVSLTAFILKGTAAIGLLIEKNWAVKLAIIDGALGIVLCILSIAIKPWIVEHTGTSFNTTHFNVRLELLLLIPYLIKMIKIRKEWEENRFGTQPNGAGPSIENAQF